MSRSLTVRLSLALAALLLLGGLLAFVISGLARLLDIGQRAFAISPLLAGLYVLLLLLFAGAGVALLWWFLRPPRRRPKAPAVPTETELSERVARSRDQGLDVAVADTELAELARRRAAGELHIALFGQISAGKSSLAGALVPEAEVQTDVRGGTTRSLHRYAWRNPGGDTVMVVDAPGINATDAADEAMAREEALRAHLVVYVCEGDLSRDQWQALESLLAFNKPLIVAINKMDRFSDADLEQVREHLTRRLADYPRVTVVAVQAGGEEEVIRQRAGGGEQRFTRPRAPRIDELVEALQQQLDSEPTVLANLRDSAVLQLAAGKLDAALDDQRRERADELVRTYTRRAMVGGMAALAPGTDLIIQGALATQFVRSVCKLFDAEVRDVEIEQLLKAANRKVRRNAALVLAIAGNGLKAFPGIGTITGGLVHAVAYGILFDTLGRAMVHNLRTRGDVRPQATAKVFESMLDDNLLPRAKRLARLALTRASEANHEPKND